MSLKDHAIKIEEFRKNAEAGSKVGLISGVFNIIHPGHLRLFKFAADCTDYLIIALNPDDASGVLVPQDLRLENLQSLNLIDHCFVAENSITEILEELKPDIVIKGKEYEAEVNEETPTLEKYGGKLLFSSGDTVFSSTHLIRQETDIKISGTQFQHPGNYIERHGINAEDLIGILSKFSEKKVMVIGDFIIDEYITCDVLGLSQEDPTIVVTPVLNQQFIGAAGIVASHARSMGALARLVTVTGSDDGAKDASKMLEKYEVAADIFEDDSRPTTLKQRYRTSSKTMLRVSKIKQHGVDEKIQKKILGAVESQISDLDLLIFSDFNYGVLPQTLVNQIINLCHRNNVVTVADSQSSSQVGDISRFKNMKLITPTELEARIAIQNHETGLVNVAHTLAHKCHPDNIFLTLGEEGCLVLKLDEEQDNWMTDRLPALCTNARDTAGAGDAMLVSSSLALVSGASIWQAALIGAVASGCQVSRVGNTPLKSSEMESAIKNICES